MFEAGALVGAFFPSVNWASANRVRLLLAARMKEQDIRALKSKQQELVFLMPKSCPQVPDLILMS
jgi:hypothetical protein